MLEYSRKVVRNYIRGSSKVLGKCECVFSSSSEFSSVFTQVVQVTSTKENKDVNEEDSSQGLSRNQCLYNINNISALYTLHYIHYIHSYYHNYINCNYSAVV